tara:strand:+ start:69 stop:572 length:504 start_codon:yes stop_codon:yes gene_type:complete
MQAKDKETMLTKKQELFCLYYAEGGKNEDEEDCLGNATASYKRAYNTKNMNKQVINNESSKLLNSHYVAIRIKTLSEEKERKHQYKQLAENERLKNKLWSVVDSEEERTSDQLKAMELLGRSIGLFKDHSITESIVSIEQASDQLNDALSDALSDKSVIELFPRDKE